MRKKTNNLCLNPETTKENTKHIMLDQSRRRDVLPVIKPEGKLLERVE